jgi:serine/threonine-protein kinase
MIYVRRLDAAHATPLPGTEGAAGPFFSPDGKFIGFMLNGRLKKVAVTGGSPTDLAAALTARGAWWVDDDSIVFAPQRDASLVRLPPGGGAPSSIAALAEGEATHRWPQVLPGARAVLYTASRVPNAAYNEASLVVQPLPAGERRVVLTGGFHGRYVSSGHIVYIHQGTLFARAFDLHRLSVTGPAFAVLEGVASDTNTGLAEFAVSGNGTLVYAPGSSTSEGVDIQWLDRAGVTSSLRSDRANWWNLRFSPDRRRLAL